MNRPILALILVVIGMVLMLGCGVSQNYDCLKEPASAASTSNSVKADAGGEAENVGQAQQPLTATVNKLLVTPRMNRRKIFVCFHPKESSFNVPDAFPDDFAKCRDTIKDAVENSWNKALADPHIPKNEQYEFMGWDFCEMDQNGIPKQNHPRELRIAFSLEPDNIPVGKSTINVPVGATVDCTYKKELSAMKWCSTPEGRDGCVHALAVRNFGLVLGLQFEEQRQDAPSDLDPLCQPSKTTFPYTHKDEYNGGDFYLGKYDPHSVMNSCSDPWLNGGNLSDGDWFGIQALYYPERFDWGCIKDIKDLTNPSAP